jgi:hypothetical protein
MKIKLVFTMMSSLWNSIKTTDMSSIRTSITLTLSRREGETDTVVDSPPNQIVSLPWKKLLPSDTQLEFEAKSKLQQILTTDVANEDSLLAPALPLAPSRKSSWLKQVPLKSSPLREAEKKLPGPVSMTNNDRTRKQWRKYRAYEMRRRNSVKKRSREKDNIGLRKCELIDGLVRELEKRAMAEGKIEEEEGSLEKEIIAELSK